MSEPVAHAPRALRDGPEIAQEAIVPGEVVSRDLVTGETWRRHSAASPSDVARAVAHAREAQRAWGARDPLDRVCVLGRFRELVFDRRREIAEVISRENGKPVVEAMTAEVATTLDIVRFYCRHAPGHLAVRRSTSASLALWRKRIRLTHEPFGVVGVISPWNYPFMLPAGIVVPALAAGNAVLLKPSELTPSCGALLGEILGDSGVPAGVFQVLQGDGRVGSALVDEDLDKVFFTGSVATGRRVAHACAQRLIPCVLELGGSDAAIVLDDADVEQAASGIAWGRFSNCGQTCTAPKRVFVMDRVYDEFLSAMERRLGTLRVGNARDGQCDVGPLISASQRTILENQRDDALARGARLLSSAPMESSEGTFAPGVLVDAPAESRVLTEETFGPLLPVVRVTSIDEAVRLANASEFGLSASVWSRNRESARNVAMLLEAGTVVINDVSLIAGMAEVSHGGVKSSGWGRSHGFAGLDECVRTRTIVDDVLPRWRQAWWFGYSPQSYARVDGFMRLAHGRSIVERLSGVMDTLRLLFRPERPI